MRESNGDGKVYVPAGDVAELFQVNPKTIARWSIHGAMQPDGSYLKLPFKVTLGGHRRYDWDAMKALHTRLNADQAGQ